VIRGPPVPTRDHEGLRRIVIERRIRHFRVKHLVDRLLSQSTIVLRHRPASGAGSIGRQSNSVVSRLWTAWRSTMAERMCDGG
jgi:hypothetical protein